MTVALKTLKEIAEELTPIYRGDLVIRTDRPGNSQSGYFMERDCLTEKVVPSSGFFRGLRTRKNDLIEFVESYAHGASANLRAYDPVAFDAAKKHYDSFVQALAANDKLNSAANEFNITFGSLNQRTNLHMANLAARLNLNLGDSFKLKSSADGLMHTLKSRFTEDAGQITILPCSNGQGYDLLQIDSMRPEMQAVLRDTADAIAQDHMQYGSYPMQPKVKVILGKTSAQAKLA